MNTLFFTVKLAGSWLRITSLDTWSASTRKPKHLHSIGSEILFLTLLPVNQGRKLCNNPKVWKIFEKCAFAVYLTGADASHQNGPVECAHCTVAKGMRSFLVSSGCPIKFWPYAFKHHLRMMNALLSRGKDESPVYMVTGQRENFTCIATFGCHVWVRPPRPLGRWKKENYMLIPKKEFSLDFVQIQHETSSIMIKKLITWKLLPTFASMKDLKIYLLVN